MPHRLLVVLLCCLFTTTLTCRASATDLTGNLGSESVGTASSEPTSYESPEYPPLPEPSRVEQYTKWVLARLPSQLLSLDTLIYVMVVGVPVLICLLYLIIKR